MIAMMAEALKAAGAQPGSYAMRVNTRDLMSGADAIDAREEGYTPDRSACARQA